MSVNWSLWRRDWNNTGKWLLADQSSRQCFMRLWFSFLFFFSPWFSWRKDKEIVWVYGGQVTRFPASLCTCKDIWNHFLKVKEKKEEGRWERKGQKKAHKEKWKHGTWRSVTSGYHSREDKNIDIEFIFICVSPFGDWNPEPKTTLLIEQVKHRQCITQELRFVEIQTSCNINEWWLWQDHFK